VVPTVSGNLQNDGYVSTSSDFSVCKEWVDSKIEDTSAPIYKIASYRNLVGCQLTLGKLLVLDNPIPQKQEYVAIGVIPWAQVMGWYDQFTMCGEKIADAVYHANPDFASVTYHKKEGETLECG
jgi:hypothetical protein